MAAVADNPWLHVAAADYEGHMAEVGQSAPLRSWFGRLYRALRPRRLAIVGCTTGGDLEEVDPAVTETIVGIDINPAFLEIARRRWASLQPRLIQADALQVELPEAGFDLVHAALVLEYVEPAALFPRLFQWLDERGTCSVVTQEPHPGEPAVSASGFAGLQRLRPAMSLRPAGEVGALAASAGFRRCSLEALDLPGGKRFACSLFEKAGRRP
jgi:SAM-dependent methyltransferase